MTDSTSRNGSEMAAGRGHVDIADWSFSIREYTAFPAEYAGQKAC